MQNIIYCCILYGMAALNFPFGLHFDIFRFHHTTNVHQIVPFLANYDNGMLLNCSDS